MKKVLSSSLVRGIMGVAIFVGLMVLSVMYFSLGDVIINAMGMEEDGLISAAIAGAINGAAAATLAMLIVTALKGLVGVDEEEPEKEEPKNS